MLKIKKQKGLIIYKRVYTHMDITLVGWITASLGVFSSFTLLYFLGTMQDEDFDKMIWYWNTLNKYFIISAILFTLICFMELLELISRFADIEIHGLKILYYSAITFVVFIVMLNIVRIIVRIGGVFFSTGSSVLFSRFGIILLYIIVFLTSVDHIKNIYSFYYYAEVSSEVIYALSIPVIIYMVFRSVKYDRLIKDGVIVVPPHIPAKFLGVAASFLIFSAAFLILLGGNEKSYNILELGALVAFILAGDSYRRDMDKALKLVGSNLHRK